MYNNNGFDIYNIFFEGWLKLVHVGMSQMTHWGTLMMIWKLYFGLSISVFQIFAWRFAVFEDPVSRHTKVQNKQHQCSVISLSFFFCVSLYHSFSGWTCWRQTPTCRTAEQTELRTRLSTCTLPHLCKNKTLENMYINHTHLNTCTHNCCQLYYLSESEGRKWLFAKIKPIKYYLPI